MKNILVPAILGGIVWFGYGKYASMVSKEAAVATPASATTSLAPPSATPAAQFSCDGRTHCSQMRSCTEATYFVQHCPNTKMDGNNDGVPCEQQWCR